MSKTSAQLCEETGQRPTAHFTPVGHANLPALLNRIGNILTRRFARLEASGDFDEDNPDIKRASHCPVAYLRDKLNPVRAWISILQSRKQDTPTADAARSFDAAICYSALAANVNGRVESYHGQARDVTEVALNAAAVACTTGQFGEALRWFEQGRSLIWSQLNDARTPFDDIRVGINHTGQSSGAPLRDLEAPSASLAGILVSENATLDGVHANAVLSRQWDVLLQIVRTVPGFEPFLNPKPYLDLFSSLPDSGPLVVVNVHATRCDAIALISGRGDPIHIPLVDFSLTKANKYRSDLQRMLSLESLRMSLTDTNVFERAIQVYRSGRRADDGVIFQVLRKLWIEIVKPVLTALGMITARASSGRSHPRIWWCTTSVASYLPIHAAGVYDGPHRQSILDYVVSSYTPTVGALIDRVNGCQCVDKGVSGLFLTSQPRAPGASPLPGTTTEVQSIYAKAKDLKLRSLILEGADVTVEQCLEHMQEYSCIHLACHASRDAYEPLLSRFIFHGGHLKLGTIIRTNLKNADLAFLSACQTSAGGEKVSDEAVHLASGMIAAGYRRVVGTMWAIQDRHAPQVANEFYEYLWRRQEIEQRGSVGVDGARSAHALHHSIQQLREGLDDSEHSLLTWIPYVHFGY